MLEWRSLYQKTREPGSLSREPTEPYLQETYNYIDYEPREFSSVQEACVQETSYPSMWNTLFPLTEVWVGLVHRQYVWIPEMYFIMESRRTYHISRWTFRLRTNIIAIMVPTCLLFFIYIVVLVLPGRHNLRLQDHIVIVFTAHVDAHAVLRVNIGHRHISHAPLLPRALRI